MLVWVLEQLADETTSHVPALAAPHPPAPLEVSAAADRAWVLLAARADHDPLWAKAVRGALFSGRNFGGEA